MLKKVLIAVISVSLVCSLGFYIRERLIPKAGTVLRHEEFRGVKCPIIADGKGGSYKWIGDVPWSSFTIEDKFDMAKRGGGYLGQEDMGEIWVKFGSWRKSGTFQGLTIKPKGER